MKLKTKQYYTCIPHITKVTNSKTKTEVKIKIPRDRLPMKLLIYQKTENFPTLEISPSILMVVGSEKDNRESIKHGNPRKLARKLNLTS